MSAHASRSRGRGRPFGSWCSPRPQPPGGSSMLPPAPPTNVADHDAVLADHERALADLAAALEGRLLRAADDGFDAEIACFNASTTHSPAVVVAAESTADVATAVTFAVRAGLPVAVQRTGHGAAVSVDRGVLISTRAMGGVTVDPNARTARVRAGTLVNEVLEAAAPHGLTLLSGSSPTVGVVGYTLGGGLPVLGRAFGFAADRVRSLEVVTADGALRTVDVGNEPELFWALRGGKGSFGIVTAMEIELVPVVSFYGGPIFFAGDSAAEVLHAWRGWVANLPEQMSTSIALLRLPPLPELPEPLRGQFVVQLRVAFVGDAGEGERLLAPMRTAGPIVLDGVSVLPAAAIGAVHMDPTDPMPARERGHLLRELPAEAIDAVLEVAGPGRDIPVPVVEIRLLGGALSRSPEVANAVSGRDAAFSVLAIGLGVPPLVGVVDGLQAQLRSSLELW